MMSQNSGSQSETEASETEDPREQPVKQEDTDVEVNPGEHEREAKREVDDMDPDEIHDTANRAGELDLDNPIKPGGSD